MASQTAWTKAPRMMGLIVVEFNVVEEFAPTLPGSLLVFGGGFGNGFVPYTF
jgi:hypothetical protein